MTWFETLTGVREVSPAHVREHLCVRDGSLHSDANGGRWVVGSLETPDLNELRRRVAATPGRRSRTRLREVVGDVQELHCDPDNTGALFQVASQFNLLEMTAPHVTPELGVGRYETDFTQGPACAIAAGAGTIYRNYFVPLNGEVGQSAKNQIDCLAALGGQLGNEHEQLWRMQNGYALASKSGLSRISEMLRSASRPARDVLRSLVRIGLQHRTQVTLQQSSHLVSQAYCSALPVAYSSQGQAAWALFARLILEAAYEAVFCAAIDNAEKTGSDRLFLTLLGGGAFGNDREWIIDAIRRAVVMFPNAGLDIAIVSHRRLDSAVAELVREVQ